MSDILDMLTPAPEFRWFLLVVNIPSMLFSLFSLRWLPSLLSREGRTFLCPGLAFGLLATLVWYESARTIEVAMTGARLVGILETVAWFYATLFLGVGCVSLLLGAVLSRANWGTKW